METVELRILEMLQIFDSLEEIFENLDITPEEVLTILFEGGYVVCPEYLELPEIEEEDDVL
jgi:hypothetical protein